MLKDFSTAWSQNLDFLAVPALARMTSLKGLMLQAQQQKWRKGRQTRLKCRQGLPEAMTSLLLRAVVDAVMENCPKARGSGTTRR